MHRRHAAPPMCCHPCSSNYSSRSVYRDQAATRCARVPWLLWRALSGHPRPCRGPAQPAACEREDPRRANRINADGSIEPSRRELFPIMGEARRQHRSPMTGEDGERSAGLDVPQPCGPVIAGCSDECTVRRECSRSHRADVTQKLCGTRRVHIVYLKRTIKTGGQPSVTSWRSRDSIP